MKLGLSHYGHKSIPDAKFESGSSFSFGDMASQIFSGRREQVNKFGYLSPKNGFNFSKMSFYVQIEKIFHFVNFWDASMRKEQQQPP